MMGRQIMIATCNECGKKYKIDASKLRGKGSTFACSACGSRIYINNPEDTKIKAAAPKASKRRIFGVKGKILILFFVVPILLIIIAGYLFVGQLNSMSAIIKDTSAGADLFGRILAFVRA